MKKFSALLIFFVAALTSVQAQFFVGLHGGATFPQGYYAESRMSDNEWMFSEGHQMRAGAGKGFLGGVDISFAMPFHPALEIAFVADFMQSAPNRDVRDYYEKSFSRRYEACSKYQMELPRIQNIPLLLGVRYAYPVTSGVDFYGEALAGLNIRRITDWTLSYASADWVWPEEQEALEYNNVDTRRYCRANTFAFRLGAGFILKKKITLGATYSILGGAPLEWDREIITRNSINGEISENITRSHIVYKSLNPSMITVQLGYRLNPFSGGRHVQDW